MPQAFLEIHITDGVDSFWELNASWKLTIPCAPLVFDTLHVPLVNQHHHSVTFTLVNCLEEIHITLVDKNPLKLREVNISSLNVPVDCIGVQTLFCERLRTDVPQLGLHTRIFIYVLRVYILPTPIEILDDIGESSLVMDALPGRLAKLWPEELQLGTNFLSRFASELCLEARSKYVMIAM